MPRIKPFYAFRPVMRLQNSVVTRPLENYSLGQARLIVSENPYSFLHLVNPELDNPYLRGSRQELIYKKVNENLEAFVENQVLIKEEKPSLYIYQVRHDGLTQTGVWALTHINDYLSGNIKKHELTVERREKSLSEYLQQTGIDANPVLLTYVKNEVIENVIAKYLSIEPKVDFIYEDGTHHLVWVVDELNDLNSLLTAFADMDTVYIADGHHRIASMAKMAIHKRTLKANNENSEFNYFSSAYFNTNQVKILPYNRMVKDLASLSIEQFLTEVSKSFVVKKVGRSIVPKNLHEFGMYVDQSWYKLIAKPNLYNDLDPVSVLDVSILQNYILKPILAIDDPRTDARITFEGGNTPIENLQQQVDNKNYAVVFTLFATSVEQLIAVADANGIMPPKSTWVEPKFLVGMLSNLMHSVPER